MSEWEIISIDECAQLCPWCDGTGLTDSGGTYPWDEGIFVACPHCGECGVEASITRC